MSRARLIFIVFYLTALLIAAAGVRIASSRTFNKFSTALIIQNRLRQQLWQKQLELEGLTGPGAVSERMEHEPKPQ
jgi:maltodextrin utilization protein YvdJ